MDCWKPLKRGAVTVDIDLKRVLARLNLQLRRMIEGGGAVAERLMVDTLYYVGRAEDGVPRVAEVKRLYGLIRADSGRLRARESDRARRRRDAR